MRRIGRGFKVDEAALGDGLRFGDGLVGEEFLQGGFEKLLRGLRPGRALRKLVVDGTAINDAPVLGADGDGFAGAFHAKEAGDALRVVFEDGERIAAKVLSLLPDAVAVVLGIGVDEPDRDAALGVALLQRAQFQQALPGDGTADTGEEEDDHAALGAAQFVEQPVMIEERKVDDLAGLRARRHGVGGVSARQRQRREGAGKAQPQEGVPVHDAGSVSPVKMFRNAVFAGARRGAHLFIVVERVGGRPALSPRRGSAPTALVPVTLFAASGPAPTDAAGNAQPASGSSAPPLPGGEGRGEGGPRGKDAPKTRAAAGWV